MTNVNLWLQDTGFAPKNRAEKMHSAASTRFQEDPQSPSVAISRTSNAIATTTERFDSYE
jgi:hypothetical protein